jgi:putative FmdB family regulatory protein
VPIYSYKCPKCGKKFDKYNPKVNESAAACPVCNYPSAQVPTTFGAVLWKGGHWNKGV